MSFLLLIDTYSKFTLIQSDRIKVHDSPKSPRDIEKFKQEIDALKRTVENLTKENSELRSKQYSSHEKTEKEIQLYQEINELKRKLNSQVF